MLKAPAILMIFELPEKVIVHAINKRIPILKTENGFQVSVKKCTSNAISVIDKVSMRVGCSSAILQNSEIK